MLGIIPFRPSLNPYLAVAPTGVASAVFISKLYSTAIAYLARWIFARFTPRIKIGVKEATNSTNMKFSIEH
jgi:hypothetical protein